ncbi:MAG: type II secretion system GspH family protein [Lachnospiraceae bacterium]|jgi:prepilin-type N-terminal cleavage/methylation domain-containing protein|nr:type II secretion system GspH family protein [Lachnospiraceae bacterium]
MKEKRFINNKGFSLVELIIVIAIMAILIGVLAPNLMRYIERTNVSADVQLAASLRMAIVTGLADPTTHDAATTTFVAAINSGGAVLNATNLPDGLLARSINETLPLTITTPLTGTTISNAVVAALRSRTAATVTIDVEQEPGGNIIVTINGTDRTGLNNQDATGAAATPIVVPAP